MIFLTFWPWFYHIHVSVVIFEIFENFVFTYLVKHVSFIDYLLVCFFENIYLFLLNKYIFYQLFLNIILNFDIIFLHLIIIQSGNCIINCQCFCNKNNYLEGKNLYILHKYFCFHGTIDVKIIQIELLLSFFRTRNDIEVFLQLFC